MKEQWTLTGAATQYTVALPEHGRWLELLEWGGSTTVTRTTANDGYLTPGDVAPVEYATDAVRPFTGADLIVETRAGDRRVPLSYVDAVADTQTLTVTLADELTGLRAAVRYRVPPGTDVVERWVELSYTGAEPLKLIRIGSAGFCLPTPDGARISYLCGQWAREFQLEHVDLRRGAFTVGSAQGVPGHLFAPWLAVESGGHTWGVAIAWTGSWEITAERDVAGLTRVRAGRALPDGHLDLAPGTKLTLPVVAGAYSPDGLDGLARVWHNHQRRLAGPRLGPRPVLYNSWEATAFAVDATSQLELARIAADLGVETFVVDDGWFLGRDSDSGGLGDWTPDPAKFPGGFGSFVDQINDLGLTFGLWVEPECVSPTSRLFAEHPEWVLEVPGRPRTEIRHQYLLDLSQPVVADHLWSTVDGLLRQYQIGFLKWDFNRPRTEPGRAGDDVDGRHVANLYRIFEQLRRDHPHVVLEACAGGGARTDLGMAARADVFWPSDNTAPLDRLAIQHGFLHANAPHLLSSWVTDAPGSCSLAFRFIVAMAGVLGIGADIRRWSDAQRAEARYWIARYKSIREITVYGDVHVLDDAIQYTSPSGVVILAWNTGSEPRTVELPFGLKASWTSSHDAEIFVLP